jgi:hypothetical protein
MRSLCYLYICVPHSSNFRMPEPILKKHCIYIYKMAPEPISKAYFINPSHQSVCLYVYPLLLLNNGSLKISLPLLGNG